MDIKEILEYEGNLLDELSEEEQVVISSEVRDGFNADKESRSFREQRMEDAMRLAMQETDEKSFPWVGCANVIIPLITTSSMHFAARAFPAIIHGDEVSKSKAIGYDDGEVQRDEQGQPVIDPKTQKPVMINVGVKKEKGEALSRFVNWQLLEQSKTWVNDTDRLLHCLPVTGNVYRKWRWGEDKPESGIILPKNFIVDYFTTDLAKARKSHTFVMQAWEIEEQIRAENYIEFDITDAPSQDAQDIVPDTRDEGTVTSEQDEAPHGMIEQYFRYDLDDDGYAEPYIATYHMPSEKVVRLEKNFVEDGVKFKKDLVVSIKEETNFIKYGFIPSPDGSFYDLGFGDILFNLNKSVNSIVNRLLDAGTLASTSNGLIGRELKLKGGEVSLTPGKFKVVESRGVSIRDNFVQIQHAEPSKVLFELLGMLIEMAKEVTFSNKVMSGEQQSNMPVGTVLQLVEQGLTGFKAIYKRTFGSIKEEIEAVWRLNSLYLDEEKLQRVLDKDGVNVGDYKGIDYDIVPVCDPSMITDQQRISKAMFAAEFKDDPRVDGVEILKNVFDAAGLDKRIVTGNPEPQEDPIAKANMMIAEAEQLKAQIKGLEAELKSQKQQFDSQVQQGKDIKTQAEIKKIESETVKNYAEAESKEAGTQIEAYKAHAE